MTDDVAVRLEALIAETLWRHAGFADGAADKQEFAEDARAVVAALGVGG